VNTITHIANIATHLPIQKHTFAFILASLGTFPASTVAQAPETITTIRVHGNYSVSDSEVIAISNMTPGDTVEPGDLSAIRERLKISGLFDEVDVRKRYQSLTETSLVAIVIVVNERPDSHITNPIARSLLAIIRQSMFLPILDYEEGYGFSYGGRISIVDTLGSGFLLSVPATWGGERRIALEAEKELPGKMIDRVLAGSSYRHQIHPTMDVADDRSVLWVGADRQLPYGFRISGRLSREHVEFGFRGDRLTRAGVTLTYRTTAEGGIPRNEVQASISIERLKFAGSPRPVLRPRFSFHGYKSISEQVIFSVRLRFDGASATLPAYEQSLLGGSETLRGWRYGDRIGDRLFALSTELTIPIDFPYSIGTTGIKFFYDTATAYSFDQSIYDVRFLKGIGGGIFLEAPFGARLRLDAAHTLSGSLRFHAGLDVSF